MEVVNGYVCKTCCDVELAKKHINPADPQDDVHNPKSPNYGKAEDAQHRGKPSQTSATPAVTFGGALARVHGAANASDLGQVPSAAYAPYSPGSVASISA